MITNQRHARSNAKTRTKADSRIGFNKRMLLKKNLVNPAEAKNSE
jgi:hypothetical protein